MTARSSGRSRAGSAASRSGSTRSRRGSVVPEVASLPAGGRIVSHFGAMRTDGDAAQRHLLGGKGAGLAGMALIGLPVPPGFTITTEVCASFDAAGGRLPAGLMPRVREHVALLEQETGKRFGSADHPLLVSVRSGAAVSMPGMMDTVLNLGLTEAGVRGLAEASGDERFALDAYRRLIAMFGDVVMGVPHALFEQAFDRIKRAEGVSEDTEVSVAGLRRLVAESLRIHRRRVGSPFPQDPYRQLQLAIEAVFRSWNAPKAVAYRRITGITGLAGTAVTVQAMVFGNRGSDSGTGVAFTRDPATGENRLYGEFLVNAQGEDVVAGIRTPRPIDEMRAWNPRVHEQLLRIKQRLEEHERDAQDIEFTVEAGRLWMLQARTAKRTGAAAVRIAVDMVREKLITREEAVLRVPGEDLTQLLLPSFTPAARRSATVVAVGLPASPGAATGRPAFTAEEATRRADAGEDVILVRKDTSPEDVEGMHRAVGILTSTGGMTSHAAVVARGWGTCCIAGAGAISIDEGRRRLSVGGRVIGPDDPISIDGSTGEVMLGELPRQMPRMSAEFSTIMKWADEFRRIGVRANADTPADARRARDFGARGIGLCRTEHMFFDEKRIAIVRQMILAEDEPSRRRALAKLLPMQRRDFIGILTAMKGHPVTIRLLDPPLHEFLPHDAAMQRQLAEQTGRGVREVRRRVDALHEQNPMLGHRGCRLAITYPEILEMQVTAIVQAAIHCRRRRIDARPEIMVPLVGTRRELQVLRERTLEVIDRVRRASRYAGALAIPVGTMIEVPRAAVAAGEIAEEADFFSFGTNDLTQLTFGYSRDDVSGFLPTYLGQGVLERDPFQTIDREGVGALVAMACERGRRARPSLKLGICGEHGGDPDSIRFFHELGLDSVSCSPYRVPVARLVGAQAELEARARAGGD
jgi:pyruvate,orthophosphate dikinase